MYEEKKYDVVVVGLGKSGFSCVRFLQKKGFRIAVMDTREEPPAIAEFKSRFPKVTHCFGKIDERILAQAKEIIVSPGLSDKDQHWANQQCKSSYQVIGDIELFCREVDAPIIAITGTNGKSTAVTLLAHVATNAGLNVKTGGNLGIPVLDLLEEDVVPDFYLLELSSFQLERVHSLNAKISTILNITSDHQDRYDSFVQYVLAKAKVYIGDGLMVLNADMPVLDAMVSSTREVTYYSANKPLEQGFCLRKINDKDYLCKGKKPLLMTSELKSSMQGYHYFSNVLAVMSIAHAMRISDDLIAQNLASFEGLPHRCNWVKEYRGVDWYNDSKGTNIAACLAALEGLGNHKNIVLIAGGDGKQADFSQLREGIQRYVKALILFGRDAPQIEQHLSSYVPVWRCDELDIAVRQADKLANPGDKVLLSPACSSLDMFSSFEERGRHFIVAVQQLGA